MARMEAPGYGMEAHKGYGTPVHRQALEALGPSPFHRLTYAPVAAVLRPDEALFLELKASIAECRDVAGLQAWVEARLRPAYGRLTPAWVEDLREAYGEALLARAVAVGP
jgi:ribonuclease HII